MLADAGSIPAISTKCKSGEIRRKPKARMVTDFAGFFCPIQADAVHGHPAKMLVTMLVQADAHNGGTNRCL